MPLLVSLPETHEGIHLGCLENGNAFRIPLSYFNYHFAFYGVTGTGKTRAAMNLAIKGENSGLNVRVIDVEGEWRNIIPKLSKETLYYDVCKNVRINPFELQDMGLTKLLLKETIFKGIELEYRELSPQMNFLLDKCIQVSGTIPKLIENVISYNPETHFPLRNLDLTRTALLTRLNPYKDNPILRKIFYTSKSNIDLEKIQDKNVVFDLHKLDMKVAYKEEMRLLYNILTINYLRSALKRSETNTIKNLFVADEAQLLVPKIFKKVVSTDTWATTDFATRLRKRGESLVIISQSPANIEDDIRKNSQNIFAFRLIDPWDVRAIAGMFGHMHTDEINYLSSMLTSLDSRTCLVKTPMAPYPFTVKTLDVIFENLSEKQLEAHLPETEDSSAIDLTEDEIELLDNIKNKPFLNNTERALDMGWHRSRYSKNRKSLLRHKLVEQVSFKTKLRGAPSRFVKIKDKKGYGRGQFIHGFWVDKISRYLKEQGLEPKMEHKVGDKIVDLAYKYNGKDVFVEVEYKSDWKSNILRASKLCDKLVSVFVREKDIIDALDFLLKEGISNVTVTDAYYSYNYIP